MNNEVSNNFLYNIVIVPLHSELYPNVNSLRISLSVQHGQFFRQTWFSSACYVDINCTPANSRHTHIHRERETSACRYRRNTAKRTMRTMDAQTQGGVRAGGGGGCGQI